MPTNRTRLSRDRIESISPRLFVIGDGTWDYFAGTKAHELHPNRESAEQHWRQCRREAWAQTNRFRIPRAAEIYDNFSNTGWELLWRSWGWAKGTFPLAHILAAVEGDRAAVAAFRANEPEAAAEIDDYLELYLQDLATIEAEAQRIAPESESGQQFVRRPEIIPYKFYGHEGDGR